MPITPLVIGPATAAKVHDADTFRVTLPMAALHPEVKDYEADIRLAGVNAAELATSAGKAARNAVALWLLDRPTGTLTVHGREKYGRVLADYTAGGESLSEYVQTLPGSRSEHVAQQLARER